MNKLAFLVIDNPILYAIFKHIPFLGRYPERLKTERLIGIMVAIVVGVNLLPTVANKAKEER